MPTCANSRRSEHMLLETVTIWMQYGFGGHATTSPTNALTAALAMPNGIRGRASQLHRCSAADGRQRQLCTAELRQLIMDGVGVLPQHLEPTCSRGLGVLLQQLNKKWLVQLVNSVCSTCHNIWNHYAVEA